MQRLVDELSNLEKFISPYSASFIQERLKNELYNLLIQKFEEAQRGGMTKAALSKRTGIDKGRLTRLLSTPGNWTIETVALLLAGIAGEEIVASSRKIGSSAANKRNHRDDDWSLPSNAESVLNTKTSSSPKLDLKDLRFGQSIP